MKNVQIISLKMVKEKALAYEYDKQINCTEIAANILKSFIGDESQEVLAMVTLDTKNKVTGLFEVHRGALSKSLVSPKEVAKRALLANAASVIIAHNHPSGDCTPSGNDRQVHEVLSESLATLEINLLDSMVIGETTYYSFAADQKMWF